MSVRAARRVVWAGVAALLAVAGVVLFLVLRQEPSQPRVSADVVPIAPGAQRQRTYVDCTMVDFLAYFPHNPCETFVLIRGPRQSSASSLLAAERNALRAHGWRHPAIRPAIDYDHHSRLAPLRDSWFLRRPHACLYVTTAATAIRELASSVRFGHASAGYQGFYNAARTADRSPSLWVRVKPPEMEQPRSCGD